MEAAQDVGFHHLLLFIFSIHLLSHRAKAAKKHLTILTRWHIDSYISHRCPLHYYGVEESDILFNRLEKKSLWKITLILD